ncbi:transposase [Patulibacter brassicae]|uniref:transposase n=1 Tax=Patulibacter brassicae TaxID=1705717 RepID=UPI0038738761
MNSRGYGFGTLHILSGGASQHHTSGVTDPCSRPGFVYVAFIVDAFSRRIVGWKADTTMRTSLVLETLEMALWARERDGLPVAPDELVHHHDNGSQYLSFAFTSRLLDAGVDASVGTVGDGYDNALAETTIGLFKTEKINRNGPWRTLAEVELATLEWVDWYNNARLHSACDRRPPAEYEALHRQGLLATT